MQRNRRVEKSIFLKKAGVLSVAIILISSVIIPSVSSQFGALSSKEAGKTSIIIKELEPLINNIEPPDFDGRIEDVYFSHGKRVYYGNQTYENANGNLYVIDNTSIDSEYVWITWILNPQYVDNTYGNGTVPQYKNVNGYNTTHVFEDLNESDMQEIKLYDTNNSLVFYASMDLIHVVDNAPSGYGIPPWGSGESQVYYGDSSLVEYYTSLAFNINYYYDTTPYNVFTDSPTLGDQNYTLYPGYELWEHRIIYELRVNRSLFDGYNIDIPATEFPDLHASPNKIGPHYIPLSPIYSSIGDYVWEDEDKDGTQDADENGMENITVDLYYYYLETNTIILGTTTTDFNGYYNFNQLTPGDYYLKFSLPTGYQFTSPDHTDDTNDSDVDITTGETTTINLSPGENDMAWDAGMYLKEFTLTIDIEGNGAVVKNPDQELYKYGTIVELTAVPGEEWSFSHWSGDLNGSNNPDYITIDSNKSVTAHFSINEYTLTINIIGEGTVIKDPDYATYPYGTIVKLTAIPDEGWIFEFWSGDLSGNENPDEILIDGDKVVNAQFKKDDTLPQVKIVRPENGVYVNDEKKANFFFPLVFNEITVEADASDEETSIEKVEFYVDGELKETDTEAPYSYFWNDTLTRFHTIEVTAYDEAGNTASDSLKIFKSIVKNTWFLLIILLIIIFLLGSTD